MTVWTGGAPDGLLAPPPAGASGEARDAAFTRWLNESMRFATERARGPEATRTARSNPDGIAAFDRLASGRLEVLVEHPTRAPGLWAAWAADGVEPGAVVECQVRLPSSLGSIRGIVVTESGHPVPDAQVRLPARRVSLVAREASTDVPEQQTITGAAGHFEFRAVAPGPHVIVTTHRPGYGEAGAALEVRAGGVEMVRLVLPKNRPVRGHIAFAPGHRAVQCEVIAYIPQDPDWVPSRGLDEVTWYTSHPAAVAVGGPFEIEAGNVRGWIIVSARARGYEPVVLEIPCPTRGDGEPILCPEIRFSRPGRRIAGAVVDEAGRPVPATVMVQRARGAPEAEQVETDAEGRFVFDSRGPGPHIVLAEPLDGQLDLSGTSVEVEPDAEGVRLVLRRPDTGSEDEGTEPSRGGSSGR